MASSSLSGEDFWLKDNEYEMETRTGDGRFATVWKAREILTGRIVAVKVFKSGVNEKGEVARRFMAKSEERMLHACRNVVSKATRDLFEQFVLSHSTEPLQLGYPFEIKFAKTIVSLMFYVVELHVI